MHKMIDKIIEWTSLVETDENGKEYLKPWTLEEFIINGAFFVFGLITGCIITWLLVMR